MKWQRIIPWIIVSIALAGCIPERYQWSPNGQWVTVLGDDDMRIADASGKLLPGKIDGVKAVAWYGNDSKRILAARGIAATTWDQVVPYLTPEQITAVKAAAERARQFAMSYDWSAPNAADWKAFAAQLTAQEERAGRDTQIYSDMGGVIAILLREPPDPALRQKIPEAQWKELMALPQTVYSVDVYDIDPTADTVFNREATVMKSLQQQVVELRVSPTSKAFLAVLSSGQENARFMQLWLAPNDGRHDPIRIAEAAAWYPDWSRDGRDVFFISPESGSALQTGNPANNSPVLGSLNRIRVIGPDGGLIDKPETDTLAGLLCDEFARVRCAPNGMIIFTSVELTLPATSADMPRHTGLFAVQPDKIATVIRLLPQSTTEQLDNVTESFEISPDGARASLPNGDGQVSVVDLATGTVTQVQATPIQLSGGTKLPDVPTWRNSDELTFAAPGEENRWSVVLWSMSNKSGKTLSTTWPAALVTDNSGPVTQPSDTATTKP